MKFLLFIFLVLMIFSRCTNKQNFPEFSLKNYHFDMIYKVGISHKGINIVFIGNIVPEKRKGYLFYLNKFQKENKTNIEIITQKRFNFKNYILNYDIGQALYRIAAEVLVFQFNQDIDSRKSAEDYFSEMNNILREMSSFAKRSKTKIIIESYPCRFQKINQVLKKITVKYGLTFIEVSTNMGTRFNRSKCYFSEKESKVIGTFWINYLKKIKSSIKIRPDRREQWRNNPQRRPN